ncbi:MAG: hypothetical protein HZB83_06160, partial [Deltaproteobacteria bacterium]|nr:hypothetical protein [Deltaproteobacteria bacterium]
VVRLNEETYGFLFLDTSQRMPRMFESISEVVAADPLLNKPFMDGALDLMAGHAIFPKDGDSFTELFTRASKRVRLNISKTYEPGF